MELKAWIRPERKPMVSEYPALNEELDAELVVSVHELIRHLYRVDCVLAYCKHALKALQPMSSGRLDIRWWGGGLAGRHPYVFRWVGLQRNRQIPVRGKQQVQRRAIERRDHPNQRVYSGIKLPRKNLKRRALKTGLFRECWAEVQEVLALVDDLLKMRKAISEHVRRTRIALRQMQLNHHIRLSAISAEIDRRLPEWDARKEREIERHAQRVHEHLKLIEEEEARRARLGFRTLKEHARILEEDRLAALGELKR